MNDQLWVESLVHDVLLGEDQYGRMTGEHTLIGLKTMKLPSGSTLRNKLPPGTFTLKFRSYGTRPQATINLEKYSP
ncbi:MAG: hypothetical protein IPM37_12420 [Hahellaceae bacterium]|nr:hypothetical protein [Hahellaceae bacterium]